MIVVQESVRRRKKKNKQTRVYNYNQEFILAGERDVKEEESHEVM